MTLQGHDINQFESTLEEINTANLRGFSSNELVWAQIFETTGATNPENTVEVQDDVVEVGPGPGEAAEGNAILNFTDLTNQALGIVQTEGVSAADRTQIIDAVQNSSNQILESANPEAPEFMDLLMAFQTGDFSAINDSAVVQESVADVQLFLLEEANTEDPNDGTLAAIELAKIQKSTFAQIEDMLDVDVTSALQELAGAPLPVEALGAIAADFQQSFVDTSNAIGDKLTYLTDPANADMIEDREEKIKQAIIAKGVTDFLIEEVNEEFNLAPVAEVDDVAPVEQPINDNPVVDTGAEIDTASFIEDSNLLLDNVLSNEALTDDERAEMVNAAKDQAKLVAEATPSAFDFFDLIGALDQPGTDSLPGNIVAQVGNASLGVAALTAMKSDMSQQLSALQATGNTDSQTMDAIAQLQSGIDGTNSNINSAIEIAKIQEQALKDQLKKVDLDMTPFAPVAAQYNERFTMESDAAANNIQEILNVESFDQIDLDALGNAMQDQIFADFLNQQLIADNPGLA